MSKLTRGEKGEELVSTSLSKIKEYVRIINNATYIFGKNDMSHQIDHILIHPYGIFVLETKNYYGEISYNDKTDTWSKDVRGKIERIANPLKQNKSHVLVVSHLLKKKYDVVGAVIFVKNNAPYVGDENLINFKDLHLFIESYPYKRILSKKEIDDIYEILMNNQAEVSHNEHVEYIGYLKQVNKESLKEKEYAIERKLCPRCNNKITVKGDEYECKSCGFHFSIK